MATHVDTYVAHAYASTIRSRSMISLKACSDSHGTCSHGTCPQFWPASVDCVTTFGAHLGPATPIRPSTPLSCIKLC